MPKQLRSLDQLIVRNPCNADWDSMSGNDRVRFCEHCSLSVTDLSRMTRHQAMRLVAQSQGRLCVRFLQDPSGRILTNAPEKLYRIGRRVSRIAAGAFTASLSLATVAAQSRSRSQLDAVRPTSEIAKTASPRENGPVLSGIITDPQGALVPGANVTLTNTQTHASFTCTSDENGAYKFPMFELGVYNLAADAASFARTETPAFNFKGDLSQTENLVLQIPPLTAQVEINAGDIETQITVTAGVVSFREPEEPLVKAAWQNDLAEVSRLALSGSDVNVIDKATDMVGLAFAVQNGKRDMVNVLLSAGANPNLANTRGETPLMYLGDHATTELVGDLLAAGADVNARDQSGATPLINLAALGSFAVVKRLLDAGARIDVEDDNGNTLLMIAAQNEDPQLLRHLLKAGLNLSAKNQNGDSALMFAARSGKADGLKALMDAGASFNLPTSDLNLALLLAAENEDSGLTSILLNAGANANAKDAGTTVLMRAAQQGYPANVKTLIDAGADLNAKDDDGWTALMHADSAEVVQVLVNAGADLTIKNKDGETALSMARRYDHTEVVKLLKSHGAPE